MATAKQIAANRENAKRSTGPKTKRGKQSSCRNALKHGLSIELQKPFAERAVRLASVIAAAAADNSVNYHDFARASVTLERIRRERLKLLSQPDLVEKPEVIKKLLALKRYERRSATALRKASMVCRMQLR